MRFLKTAIAFLLLLGFNSFTITKKIDSKPKDEYNIVVAQDGSGDYKSIQEAIYNSPSFPYKRVTITVKNGIYKEKVHVPEWNTNLSLIGENKEKTIIKKKVEEGTN